MDSESEAVARVVSTLAERGMLSPAELTVWWRGGP